MYIFFLKQNKNIHWKNSEQFSLADQTALISKLWLTIWSCLNVRETRRKWDKSFHFGMLGLQYQLRTYNSYFPNCLQTVSHLGYIYVRSEQQIFFVDKNWVAVNNYEIVVNFLHISHTLTWYSAIVHKFTRIYQVCSNYELTKQFM
jgi:hypothetical protein